MGSGIGTILASIGIPLAVDLIKKMTAEVHQDLGEVLCKENKMAMEPLDWVCMNHLLLLEHENRCMVVVKKKELQRATVCYYAKIHHSKTYLC